MFEQFPLGSNDAPVIAIAKSQAQAQAHTQNKQKRSKQATTEEVERLCARMFVIRSKIAATKS